MIDEEADSLAIVFWYNSTYGYLWGRFSQHNDDKPKLTEGGEIELYITYGDDKFCNDEKVSVIKFLSKTYGQVDEPPVNGDSEPSWAVLRRCDPSIAILGRNTSREKISVYNPYLKSVAFDDTRKVWVPCDNSKDPSKSGIFCNISGNLGGHKASARGTRG